MYGYDKKTLTLNTTEATTITVEVDFLADNTWSAYKSFSLAAGESITHEFPDGFHAHWVRVKSSTATIVGAQFVYGPADRRDRFLDWAREKNLPTGAGRGATAESDPDGDGLANLLEYLTNGDPKTWSPNPVGIGAGNTASIVLRNLEGSDHLLAEIEFSTDLEHWESNPEEVVADPDQSGVATGFTRYLIQTESETGRHFVRLKGE